MNKELLNQLAHQASFWCDQNIPEQCWQFSEKIMGYGEAWEEKFAELIVRECSKVLTQHGAYFSGDGEPYHYAAHLIEEHFGVEE